MMGSMISKMESSEVLTALKNSIQADSPLISPMLKSSRGSFFSHWSTETKDD
jgi:hypothetical protein